VSITNNKNDKNSAVTKSDKAGGEPPSGGRKPVKAPPNAKPSVIIDILDEEGPYRIIEPPVELVNLGESDSDRDAADDASTHGDTAAPNMVQSPPDMNDGEAEDRGEEVDAVDSRVRTPPAAEEEDEAAAALPTPSKGPMTPPEEPPMDNSNSYDPFEPTDSPEQEEDDGITAGGGGGPLMFSSPPPPMAPMTPPLQPETPPLLMSPPPMTAMAAAAPLPPPSQMMLLLAPPPQRPPSPPVATVIPFLSSSSPQHGLATPEPLEKFSYIRQIIRMCWLNAFLLSD
jgi:hypothetical protein